MATTNETVADIVREMVEFGNHCAAFGGAYSPERWDNLCKRLNLAHKRALAAKDDERLTIVAMYENVIVDKDAEISKLRERIKVAEYALTELQTRLVSSVYDGTMNPYEALEITERAIAAISEEGGAK